MSTFVLIHGAAHGAWCWYKVIPLLEKQGHTVLAPDLPGHGRDKTPLADITLQLYVESVCKLLDAQQVPVILVGHSMGGRIITQVGEERPERIKCLVYLAAALPRSGQALFTNSERDPESVSLANMVISPDGMYATFRESALKEMFYEDCTEEDIALAKVLVAPQAVAPFTTPVRTSDARWGNIPRVYIACSKDRAVTPPFQKRYYTESPCRRVFSMDTSHSPFFAAPQQLTEHLTMIAKDF